ncbi:purine-cytosine permease FCY21 [Colletotrichum spaethianum]|uniref:Purine-cytosine permease FCY21 n=1 Tax=Colletotrichum spaethianum TaxID=700344 RepID=A0AA37PHG7_9PEZI|nr:purine-cytosine permease FCY21 [Colletotrichum spaethianum]GKT52416.1 purine-cytosine permease FCY21 [Colletotrichum spaethianum]
MDRYDEQGMGEKTSPQASLEAGSDDRPKETGILATLRRFEGRMDKALGVESHAIDRKMDADKSPVKWHEELTMALLWASGTMGISCFATGFLGWEFGLDLKRAIPIFIFGSILGGAVSGYCATFGAATGLRQISVSRFSFGWWPNKLIAFLNGVEQLGWASVGSISGGLALTAVADGRISLVVVVYGSSASWATMVSDYYVHYPTNVSRLKVFILTTLGIAIPTSFGMTAGAVVASSLNNQTAWANTYENQGLGFLIRDMLHPRGFAKFLLVIFSFSGINTNIISLYSAAISFQQMARPFAKVPRFLWTLLCFAVVIGLALGGRSQLNTYLQNFLSLLGYWCTSYFIILLMEHSIFRRGDFANYDLDGWNDPSRLPHGIGASVAFLVGVVAWCMGMVETWFVGPLGGLIGESGGDIANEMTLVVTAVVYLPARYLELKFFGR